MPLLQTTAMTAQELKTLVAREAREAGFDAVGFAAVDGIGAAGQRLARFLAEGRHGDMHWMQETAARRQDPRALWPDARSAVMLGISYAPERDPMEVLAERSRGAISCYAQGKDYHDIVKAKLKHVARRLAGASGAEVKVFVDTAPLMEKPLAAAAGLGWQGKHTNLVSRSHGSWLFLGAILSAAELPPDTPEADHCGSCSRCIDACPTAAIGPAYTLDPRRCIAYLTIEHQGHIAREWRTAIGNRVFGCDDCLAVCPWNKFAAASREARFHARAETDAPGLAELLDLDDARFRARFAGTPVKRTGRDRFIRNVLIAAGNSGDVALAPAVSRLASDVSPLVRAMVAWALPRLSPSEAARIREEALAREEDPAVRGEWEGEVDL